MPAKENVKTTIDDEQRSIPPPRRLPPIPEDKLHRVSFSFLFKTKNKLISFREIHIQYDKK
jgi:hypothetical protein